VLGDAKPLENFLERLMGKWKVCDLLNTEFDSKKDL
jgi:hypothetical protein